jgi:hypothetical protein
MCWFMTLALLGVAAWPVSAEENEAENLYRGMEKKVGAAKTLRVRFDLTITDAEAKKWSLSPSAPPLLRQPRDGLSPI